MDEAVGQIMRYCSKEKYKYCKTIILFNDIEVNEYEFKIIKDVMKKAHILCLLFDINTKKLNIIHDNEKRKMNEILKLISIPKVNNIINNTVINNVINNTVINNIEINNIENNTEINNTEIDNTEIDNYYYITNNINKLYNHIYKNNTNNTNNINNIKKHYLLVKKEKIKYIIQNNKELINLTNFLFERYHLYDIVKYFLYNNIEFSELYNSNFSNDILKHKLIFLLIENCIRINHSIKIYEEYIDNFINNMDYWDYLIIVDKNINHEILSEIRKSILIKNFIHDNKLIILIKHLKSKNINIDLNFKNTILKNLEIVRLFENSISDYQSKKFFHLCKQNNNHKMFNNKLQDILKYYYNIFDEFDYSTKFCNMCIEHDDNSFLLINNLWYFFKNWFSVEYPQNRIPILKELEKRLNYKYGLNVNGIWKGHKLKSNLNF